jgi:alpha-beta hydrolase superfamily lysophospholipase
VPPGSDQGGSAISTRRATAVALLAVLALLAGAACSSDAAAPEATTRSTLRPPAGLDPFYGPPDPVPDGRPGDLLAYERVYVDGTDGSQWRVMYLSEALDGEPVVVTGLVFVPPGPAPDGGRPVVTWAHGTTGVADECAPSIDPRSLAPLAGPLLEQGWVVVATDYEGLGTPGRHPYLVGQSEGRGVLDIVTAARSIPEADVGDRYAIWGHSQGGHAALFAGHLAPDWAPDLELTGVVAGAPPSQLLLLNAALQRSSFKHYVALSVAGLNAAYGDDEAPLDAVLTPEGIDWLSKVDEECATNLAVDAFAVDFSRFQATDPAGVPSWRQIIEENDPGTFTTPIPAPLLIVHGQADEQIPVLSSAALFEQLCAIGQVEQRWVYPDATHVSVVGQAADDMVEWLRHRFEGRPAPDPMTPTGPPVPVTQSCPER